MDNLVQQPPTRCPGSTFPTGLEASWAAERQGGCGDEPRRSLRRYFLMHKSLEAAASGVRRGDLGFLPGPGARATRRSRGKTPRGQHTARGPSTSATRFFCSISSPGAVNTRLAQYYRGSSPGVNHRPWCFSAAICHSPLAHCCRKRPLSRRAQCC
ncbi:hypothetical protein K466DRAFT_73688 [Polyporus arcularius HHB13444]|uniref:Uncharacterized protein n=1 Tax=Polyporus arcularius HHB13444 TaxID=1314778 RepID=A0A5C3PJL5_9APHY|nr:hypothetical protein K466DRAFT_73688 [Polyporus arcularius HHB13444]